MKKPEGNAAIREDRRRLQRRVDDLSSVVARQQAHIEGLHAILHSIVEKASVNPPPNFEKRDDRALEARLVSAFVERGYSISTQTHDPEDGESDE